MKVENVSQYIPIFCAEVLNFKMYLRRPFLSEATYIFTYITHT